MNQPFELSEAECVELLRAERVGQARGSVVGFEVDDVDHERHQGWSIVVRSRADVVTHADALDDIKRAWKPDAWAAGGRNVYLRVAWSQVSGRLLGGGWNPLDSLPVRRVV